MNYVYRKLRFLIVPAAVWAVLFVATGRADDPDARRADGKVLLLHEIDTTAFGVWCGLRIGELNGDGRLDFALAQNDSGQHISCITAMDVTGKILWQHGTPKAGRHRTGFDLPIQIYDLDQDGQNEVIYAADGKLKILCGKTGKLEREAPLPADNANDCIALANFSGNLRPQDILVKTRYDQVWALDRELKVLWTHRGNTGHYCWPHDFDGDGRDELVCGYSLLSHEGKKLWEVSLPGHSDGVAVGNLHSDPAQGAQIAHATCGGNVFALISQEGKVLWQRPCGHSQHIVIGDFRPNIPGKELAALDRQGNRSASGVDAMVLYTCGGDELWREARTDPGPNRWLTILTTVCDWDDRPGDLLLAYRRGGSISPTLYDGNGNPVATFAFPHPENQHFAQHADILGDAREEIVVWNEQSVYVYGNAAPCPKSMRESRRQEPDKRLYNFTHYIGMP